MDIIFRFITLKFLEWRVRSIVIAVLVSLFATALVYLSGYGRDPATHFGAIFAGWVGGLALFVVAGTVVAIVSLVKPEDEFFDYRARILFRNQSGKHIDYIVNKLKSSFEFYTEYASMEMVIKEYDEFEKKFRIEQCSKVRIKSYIDDVATNYESSAGLRGVSPPPPGKSANRLAYVRINGVTEGVPERFDGEIDRKFSTAVGASQTCEVEYSIEFWVKAESEPNTHTPKRYTQNLVLVIENRLDGDTRVNLKLKKEDGQYGDAVPLENGHKTVILTRSDVQPEQIAYDVRICSG